MPNDWERQDPETLEQIRQSSYGTRLYIELSDYMGMDVSDDPNLGHILADIELEKESISQQTPEDNFSDLSKKEMYSSYGLGTLVSVWKMVKYPKEPMSPWEGNTTVATQKRALAKQIYEHFHPKKTTS